MARPRLNIEVRRLVRLRDEDSDRHHYAVVLQELIAEKWLAVNPYTYFGTDGLRSYHRAYGFQYCSRAPG